jgi:hypothetical protein
MFVLYPAPIVTLLRLFRTWPVRMGFMVDKITQRQVFFRVLQLSPLSGIGRLEGGVVDKMTLEQISSEYFGFPLSVSFH